MSSEKDGLIVILSSPSGAGKTTLAKKILEKRSFVISISHTTRPPRSNEINGKDYFFVSEIEFQKLIKNGEFLEHAKVFNNYYGSSKKNVLNNLNKGKNVIFDIDWQGAAQIREQKLKFKLITVFILPPSRKELSIRLLNRDIKDKSIAEERMNQFNKDILHWGNYNFVVINDNLEICCNQIINFIDGKEDYNKKEIENHVNHLLDKSS